ncbi:uncharacterized protein LOC136078459 [Hydra vulgaris]|uniref:Uncharacterized protein LOC136078459 n=1 Tax=Hydra vulgaris TaxID=6087 RepID=A0ABM4BMJ0_HYDVU
MALRRPIMYDFDSLSLTEIGAKFKYNLEDTICWCRTHGLLAESMSCSVCGVPCTQQAKNNAIDQVIWRCPVKRCKRTFSIRKGSFFEKSHLHLWQVLGLTYVWSRGAGKSRGFSVSDLTQELNVASDHTIVDWNQFCRDICVEYFLNNPDPIGGPGCIVEIDESVFCKRKNHVGRITQQQWIFGGYEPATKKGFLIPVQNRYAATLIPIIHKWILPGTTIWSDMWAAYNGLQGPLYQHGTVNHTYNFVDPQTAVTANHVEAMWCRAKAKFKSMMSSTNREMITDYLSEFMWMQRFNEHRFYHFWNQVVTAYPV